MAAVSEGLALGQALGLDARTLSAVFNTSSARCWSSEAYNPCPGVMDAVRAGPGAGGRGPRDGAGLELGAALQELRPAGAALQELPCRSCALRSLSGGAGCCGRAQVPSARDYKPGFGAQLMLKDLGLALQVSGGPVSGCCRGGAAALGGVPRL
jgi:hypothetical protein